MVRFLIKTLALFTAALVPLAGGAAADELPRWDMRKFCTSQAVPTSVDVCVTAQHEARERARSLWAKAGEAEKAECLRWLTDEDIPPSYYRLENCLESEARR